MNLYLRGTKKEERKEINGYFTFIGPGILKGGGGL
jgi:hypothetical protein